MESSELRAVWARMYPSWGALVFCGGVVAKRCDAGASECRGIEMMQTEAGCARQTTRGRARRVDVGTITCGRTVRSMMGLLTSQYRPGAEDGALLASLRRLCGNVSLLDESATCVNVETEEAAHRRDS